MKLIKKKKVTAIYESGITLVGLSPEQLSQIKEDLTFDNPLYANIQKYSKYATTRVSPFLTYYSENRDGVKIPIGYDLSKIGIKEVVDNRCNVKCEYPPFVLTLRETQREASESYLTLNKNFVLKGSIKLPTGKGKTILALFLAKQLSAKTLVVVHKDDLVKGWKNDIKLAFDNKVTAGLIKAKKREIGEQITIATVQTLNRLTKEELQELYSTFGLVIQDEMHHCPANSFEVVSNFKARYKLGLTATPERADGLAHIMNLYFGDFCYEYTSNSDDEDILPVKVKVITDPIHFDPLCKISTRGYTLDEEESSLRFPAKVTVPVGYERLSEIPYSARPRVQYHLIDDYVVKGLTERVCKDVINEYNQGHSCLVFLSQKEHCRIYAEALKSKGVPESDIGLYYGDNKENNLVYETARDKRKYITIATYKKATEGTNVKTWEVEFLVSSLNNEKNTEQAVGRIRRTAKNKINPVLLYDYRTPDVYSFRNHGSTRDSRYRLLGFSYDRVPSGKLFSRGYR